MEELTGNDTALPEEYIILDGRYRLEQLLHRRPRVNLYLGRRLSRRGDVLMGSEGNEPLVAIRELVLSGLSPQLRGQVEQAAFDEFVSPAAPGFSHLSRANDRAYAEGDKLYLVMQPGSMRSEERGLAVTLAELLRSQREWPAWLDVEKALAWGIQLCRIVARLHRLGVVLGDLDPLTVLVDREGAAEWAPILLVSWPPAPQFWSVTPTNLSVIEQYTGIFPIAINSKTGTFGAPETLKGVGDKRSDVYSLGAILYLLLTRYAPASVIFRQRYSARSSFADSEASGSALLESLELIPPRLFNSQVPQVLENVLLHALAFDPAERYTSAFALAEALEDIA